MAHHGIGTLQETSLHAALKAWYARPGEAIEALVDGYVIDLVRGDLLIEIQTGNFSALRPKLARLLEGHVVRVVYPIPRERYIMRIANIEQMEKTISSRKSPKRGQLADLFGELVHIAGLASHPNFSLEVLLIREETLWLDDGRGSWRRKGWSIHDRRLVEVVERVVFASPDDYRRFLLPGLPQPFTVRELAEALSLPRYLAGKMAYCLREMRVISPIGRRRQAMLYSIALEKLSRPRRFLTAEHAESAEKSI